jgi:outer membrane protein OmpA-like peptidoglycan-associated protein
MKSGCGYTFICLLGAALLFLTSCAHTTTIPSQSLDFEDGMKILSKNLADQLEKSSIGNMLNKIVVNPLTKQSQLKKIVIDPFIDAETGYPLKVNARINEIISAEIAKRFAVAGEMEPENLFVSEYVLSGMVSLENQKEGQRNVSKVYAAVFEKSSGIVHASASVLIDQFDTTPMDIYKDSPVYLKGQNYDQHVASVKKLPNETVEPGYRAKLDTKALKVKGDRLYEQKEFNKSQTFYNMAADRTPSPEMEILNGQFTNAIHQGKLAEAEKIYGKLLRVSISETSEISSKISFGPNSKQPLASKSALYNVYIREIANFVASDPRCHLKIVGHSSRTGTVSYTDQLSLQRALNILKQMEAYEPSVEGRSEAIGRGFRENIVGSGKDDITDEIDRRVEFKFIGCGH